jgi:hypothetical protein
MGRSVGWGFEDVLPEPGQFWIRHAPKRWPGPVSWWVDLARAELAGSALQGSIPERAGEASFEDVVYLPPVASEAGLWRQHLIERSSALGVSVVVQLLPGEPVPVGEGPVVFDLTLSLLERKLARLSQVVRGSWAVWPLIPGLTDERELWEEGLGHLARARVVGVHGLAPDLSAVQRRKLSAYGKVRSYRRLFHAGHPSVEAFARLTASHGLAFLPERPRGPGSGKKERNRALATHFLCLADLWLRNQRAEGKGQDFFQVARWIEQEQADVSELARLGKLGSVEWLQPDCRREIETLAAGEESTLLSELWADYLGEGIPSGSRHS